VLYLMGSIWVIVAWKTGVANPRFLLAGSIIFFVIAVLLAFAFLIGVLTSSTAVSIMTSYGIFFFGLMLAAHDRIAAAVSKEWQAWVIETLYWVFPKSAELGQAVVAFVGGEQLPKQVLEALSPAPFLSTGAFGAICLILASWLFTKKEF
jgi:hypothetical protein